MILYHNNLKKLVFTITVILFMLVIPITVFAEDFNKCSSLIDNNGDNIPEKIPSGHLDFSYCDLNGNDLSEKNLIESNF